jgi:hypothetical protein
MLPVMSNMKNKLIAATVAVSLLATSAVPAMAWGQREQDFAKGALAAVIIGTVIQQSNHNRHRKQPVYRDDYRPVYRQPTYYQPAPVYRQPTYYQPAPVYRQPTYYQPQPSYQQSIYSTPAAEAFNSYSRNERIRIQATLSNYGYYNGSLDGSFGPGTYNAIADYATRSGKANLLQSRGGAYGLFDALIG